jgi:hypothetical protein
MFAYALAWRRPNDQLDDVEEEETMANLSSGGSIEVAETVNAM